MTIREANLEEMESVVRPNKKSVVRCKQVRSRRIEAVFPAACVLVTTTHVHLANWLAAWEFDPTPELEASLQEGLSYVFRATWDSEAYELDGRTYLSWSRYSTRTRRDITSTTCASPRTTA